MTTKKDLQLYIKQGNSYKELLQKVNRNGQYDRKIAKIEKKLAAARKKLQSI
ncbi:MAG: hypothetical protein H0Z35_10490 [Thermoanaerobacteraceae bacterium]|nr:hypothetical protein [Thermoanaerobacteraceae bacterium]